MLEDLQTRDTKETLLRRALMRHGATANKPLWLRDRTMNHRRRQWGNSKREIFRIMLPFAPVQDILLGEHTPGITKRTLHSRASSS